MSWLRHPPHPAERLAQRLGFKRSRAEDLYAELKRRHRWLSWPGVIIGMAVVLVWIVTLVQLLPLIFGVRNASQLDHVWKILLELIYTWGVVFAGGLYLGSLAKWHMNDRAIRRFIAEFIDTPKCLACGYGLTGVPRSPDGQLCCPECTQDWPWHKRIPGPRPHMSAIDQPRTTDSPPPSASV